MNSRRFKSFRNIGSDPESRASATILLTMLGAIVLLVMGTITAFVISLERREQVTVPDISRLDFVEAVVALQERELIPRVQQRYSTDPAERGLVINQSPAPGTVVRAGREISVVVSRGAVVDRVGNYVGRQLDEVRLDLQGIFASTDEQTLRIGEIITVFADADPGTILEQDPPANTELTSLTALDLVVSRGPDVQQIELPAFGGIDFREARDLMAEANIPFVFAAVRGGPDDRPGAVVRQTPPAGSLVEPGTPVSLTVVRPDDLPPGQVFGIFQRTLPGYAVPVTISVQRIGPDGERELLFTTQHPGGPIAVPYVAEIGSTIALLTFDTEIARELVRASTAVD